MALALGEIGAVDGEDRDRGHREQRQSPRVMRQHDGHRQREARVGDRHERVHAQHLAQRGGVDHAFRQRHRRRDEDDRQDPCGECREVHAGPRLRTDSCLGDDAVEDEDGQCRGNGELREVEGDLDRREPPMEDVDEPGSHERAREQLRRAGEQQPEHHRHVGQREGMGAAPELQVDHAKLAGGEAERDQPPRQVRCRKRPVPADGAEQEREREHPEQRGERPHRDGAGEAKAPLGGRAARGLHRGGFDIATAALEQRSQATTAVQDGRNSPARGG